MRSQCRTATGWSAASIRHHRRRLGARLLVRHRAQGPCAYAVRGRTGMNIDLETREAAPRADNQHPALFGQTPSQTVRPYFHYGLPWKGGADLVGKSDLG